MAAGTTTARSGRVLGLISAAHFMSHFWTLSLPPLFPVLALAFHVNFLQLGVLMTVYNVSNALCQMPFGYLADRYGPKPVLVGGLLLDAFAFGLAAVAPSYGALLALVLLAGVGQAVFHPADYAILSALFEKERAGKPYSLHTFMGWAGSAAAPLVIATLNQAFGWQIALAATGVAGAALTIVMVLALEAPLPVRPVPSSASAPSERGALAIVFTQTMVMLFVFYVFTTMASAGLQSFLPSTLTELYRVQVETANGILTVYLAALAFAVLAGGVVADRIHNFPRAIGVAFVAVILMVVLVALIRPPVWLLLPIFGLTGALQGIVMPSRDKMVREVSPEGAAGKTFAFVSVGMSVGGIIAPLILGAMLDQSQPATVFWTVAAFLAVATVMVVLPARSMLGRARRQAEEHVSA